MLEELKYKNLISNFASQKARKIDFKQKKFNIYIYMMTCIIECNLSLLNFKLQSNFIYFIDFRVDFCYLNFILDLKKIKIY